MKWEQGGESETSETRGAIGRWFWAEQGSELDFERVWGCENELNSGRGRGEKGSGFAAVLM